MLLSWLAKWLLNASRLMEEKNPDEEGIIPEEKAANGSKWRHYLKVLAVKPVTIFYGMSFVVTNSVDAQLWLDRQAASKSLFYVSTMSYQLSQIG